MSNLDLNDPTIDSRDIEERIDELTAAKEEWEDANGEGADEYTPETMPDEFTKDEQAELDMLTEFRDEAGTTEWTYGQFFIREDYFTEYCEQELIDCGYLPSDMPSFICIDMEATADNMREDYFEVELDGETYLTRQ